MKFFIPTPYDIDLEHILGDPMRWASFNKKAARLPLSLRSLLTGVKPGTNFVIAEQIGDKENLSLGQLLELTRIVRDVVIGDMFIGDMRNAIMKKLAVDEQKATAILNAIVTHLFKEVADDLKKVQRERFPERVMQSNDTLHLKDRSSGTKNSQSPPSRSDGPQGRTVFLPKQNLPQVVQKQEIPVDPNTVDLRNT